MRLCPPKIWYKLVHSRPFDNAIVSIWPPPNKKLDHSGDEIANVNFLYAEIVHALQNTIDWCTNSAADRRGYVLERRFTKFSEITQCNGHTPFNQRSPILVPIESSSTYTCNSCYWLIPPILHRFRDIAFQTFGLRPLRDRHLSRLRPSSRLILGQFVSLLVSTRRLAQLPVQSVCPVHSYERVLPNNAL